MLFYINIYVMLIIYTSETICISYQYAKYCHNFNVKILQLKNVNYAIIKHIIRNDTFNLKLLSLILSGSEPNINSQIKF